MVNRWSPFHHEASGDWQNSLSCPWAGSYRNVSDVSLGVVVVGASLSVWGQDKLACQE